MKRKRRSAPPKMLRTESAILEQVSLKLYEGNDRRRFKYSTSFPFMAHRLALLGCSNSEMARVFGVTERVFYSWIAKFDELREAIEKGKEAADGQVVASLYKAAVGYERNEEVILANRVKTYNEFGKVVGEHTEALRVPIKKYYPPNVKAAIKILETRHPEKWASQLKRLQVGGDLIVNKIDLKDFSDKELEMLEKIGYSKIQDAEIVEEE
jgi:hypothetical protein